MLKIALNENSIRYIVKKCIHGILKESKRMTEYFIVDKMLSRPMNIDMGQITKHFESRSNRVEKLVKKASDFGLPTYSFLVNCGHTNGMEIHTITDKGIIIIQNARNKNIITFLIARPGQVIRYWKNLNIELPKNDEKFDFIMKFCELHKKLGHNKF